MNLSRGSNYRLARGGEEFGQMLDARQLTTSMKAPTLKALVVGDNGKKRERKAVDLLCHRLSVIVLEVVGKKTLRLGKSEQQQQQNRTEPERRSKCLDTDPRRQFKSTMRRRGFWSSLETKGGLCNS